MVYFYQYLKEGMDKDEALREAKLKYLSDLKVPEMAHPFYWAGFIALGNNRPVDLKRGINLGDFILPGVLLFMLIAFFLA